MSFAALQWAWRQPAARQSTKLVLLALAHCANGENLTWPSLAALGEMTGVSRRAIARELKHLKRASLIEDSGQRRGATKQIVVRRLTVEQESLPLGGKSAIGGTVRTPANSASYWHPSADGKGAKSEGVQIRAGKSATGGTRNRKELTDKNTDVFLSARGREQFEPPKDVPPQAWHDFLTSPKRRKAGMSQTAYAGICRNLNTLAEHGYPPGEMVALMVEHGWLTVKLEWVQNVERPFGNQEPADGLSSTARAALQVFGR
jgi:hypothetical protein